MVWELAEVQHTCWHCLFSTPPPIDWPTWPIVPGAVELWHGVMLCIYGANVECDMPTGEIYY